MFGKVGFWDTSVGESKVHPCKSFHSCDNVKVFTRPKVQMKREVCLTARSAVSLLPKISERGII